MALREICRLRLVSAAVLGAAVWGCGEKAAGPWRLANETLGPMTIAVAPALNVSGSPDVEPNRVADLMASELSYVADVEVIPVNRVLAVLAEQRKERVESPGHALEIAAILGADAVLVVAVTEYDAYDPPVVGLAAQIYGRRRGAATVGFDPIVESRYGSPVGGSAAPPVSPPGRSTRGDVPAPVAQTERVFDASHERVRAGVRRFAESRTADSGPFGWRKYLASQQHYLRYCCHETIRALIGDTTAEPDAASSG